ncbi:MAG: hypothetical protein QOG82_726 [Actinomycetota bacterium]|nr:hypothetical protein [Actinomycetota bacterium]
MGRVIDRVRRTLPEPVARRVRWARAVTAQTIAGAELHALAQEIAATHEAAMAESRRQMLAFLADRETERHQYDLELIADFLARQDAVLAGYDRRVAALTVRVLDLEDRLKGPGDVVGASDVDRIDMNAVIDAHHPPA